MMKKRYLLSAAGALGVSVAGYYLKEQQNRDKLKEFTNGITNKLKDSDSVENRTFENAGVPDQSDDYDIDQLENSKMVSEGSQFGVQYYNEKKKENTSENQQE